MWLATTVHARTPRSPSSSRNRRVVSDGVCKEFGLSPRYETRGVMLSAYQFCSLGGLSISNTANRCRRATLLRPDWGTGLISNGIILAHVWLKQRCTAAPVRGIRYRQ